MDDDGWGSLNSSDWKPPDIQAPPLRQRILQESRLAAQERPRRHPSQKYLRRPKLSIPGTEARVPIPGTAGFDSRDLRPLPQALSKHAGSPEVPLVAPASIIKRPAGEIDVLNMTRDEYHASVQRELDLMQEAVNPTLQADETKSNPYKRSRVEHPSPVNHHGSYKRIRQHECQLGADDAACTKNSNFTQANSLVHPSKMRLVEGRSSPSWQHRSSPGPSITYPGRHPTPCTARPSTAYLNFGGTHGLGTVPLHISKDIRHPLPNPEPDSETTSIKQPVTRPITEQQLIDEVKGIYAGLVMVEKKCVEIVALQSQSTKRLSDQQWKALVALHRTLLQEHHDFFSASQHPTASEALKKLAVKYAMPARMWRHGIHNFLELLRHRLPDSRSHLNQYAYHVADFMDKLSKNIPQLSLEWDLIKDNLREYFVALRADGVDVPSWVLDRFTQEESVGAKIRKFLFPPMQGHFFGDDDIAQDLAQEYMQNWRWSDASIQDDEAFANTDLVGTAQLILMGWLWYARKIATSYHVYCQVFIFLFWVVLEAKLMTRGAT